ncbi:MAG: putative lipoprotein [Bacteroidota bacterium]|nr:putative lipoprotein [Bacteroidota bacterium]
MKTTIYSTAKKLFIFLLMLSMSYALHANDRIKGNGQLKTETRTISAFKEIRVSHAVKLVITQEEKYAMKIEGDENLLPYLEIKQEGNLLDIGMKRGHDFDFDKGITVYISFKELNSINASGASGVESKNLIKEGSFEINSSGASRIVLNLEVSTLETVASGASQIVLNGKTSKAAFNISGASDLSASEFATDDVVLNSSGASKAFVNASKSLDVTVSGASNVKYTGAAAIIKKDISGVSSFKHTSSKS